MMKSFICALLFSFIIIISLPAFAEDPSQADCKSLWNRSSAKNSCSSPTSWTPDITAKCAFWVPGTVKTPKAPSTLSCQRAIDANGIVNCNGKLKAGTMC